MHRLLVFLLLLLAACEQQGVLPLPEPLPTALSTRTVEAEASPTGETGAEDTGGPLLPLPQFTPPTLDPGGITPGTLQPPPLLPSPTAPANSTALPALRTYTDPAGLFRVRVPQSWQVGISEAPGRVVTWQEPGVAVLRVSLLPGASDAAAMEQHLATVLGADATFERETFADGTLRVTGSRSSQPFEMHLFPYEGLLATVLGTAVPEQWEAHRPIFAEAFTSFHLFLSATLEYYDLPVPEPSTEKLEVGSLHTYTTSANTLWMVGEVQNRGPLDVELVEIQVELLSGDGQVLTSTQAFTEAPTLLTGESTPFVALLTVPPELNWVSVRARPQPPTTSNFIHALIHHGLRVAEVAAVPTSDGTVRLEGTVRNESDQPAAQLKVVGALYDGTGQILAVTRNTPLETVAPFATLPFTLNFFGMDEATLRATTRFEVWVYGYKVPEEAEAPPTP